jgi:hypothetical protein
MPSGVIKILFVFIVHHIVFAQESTTDNVVITDSSMRFKGIVRPLEINYNFDELFLPFDDESKALPYDNQSTIWLRTNLALSSNLFATDDDYHQHFLLPLYKQYLEDSKFDPIRYALGMAQLSAVSYLAYRHVKKYGFFK